MKVPESIRIAGVEYKVNIVPNLMNGAAAAYGHIDFDNSTIELSDTFGIEHQKRCCILWHEILHGIREANGMEIENEEAVVDMFAKGIYQVLQDNGTRFFDILSEANCCMLRAKSDTISDLNKQIEYWQRRYNDILQENKKAKAEAVREFAERLKDAFPEANRDYKCPSLYWDDFCDIIDNCAEEMVGEEE